MRVHDLHIESMNEGRSQGMPHQSAKRGRSRGRFGRAAVALVGLGFLLAACGGESEWMPPSAPRQVAPGGVWVGQASQATPPEIMTAVIGGGPKVHMFAGHTLGYELTALGPSKYRFRWTTDNLVNHSGVRRFTGAVSTAGHFLTFSPGCDDGSCDLEDGDHVSGVQKVAGGERIDWDTLAKDGWDGFSFTTDGAPLHFDVNVDGRARPELLELVTWNEPYVPPSRVGAPSFPPAAD
jgi:hypothetical protein